MSRALAPFVLLLALAGAGYWASRSHAPRARTVEPQRPVERELRFDAGGAQPSPLEPEPGDESSEIDVPRRADGRPESLAVESLRVEEPTLVASGIVVGRDGEPKAWVTVNYSDGDDLDEPSLRRAVTTGDDGRFELHGPSGSLVRLLARRTGVYHEVAQVERGSVDVEVPDPTATIRIEVLADPDMQEIQSTVSVARGEEGHGHWFGSLGRNRAGSYDSDEIEPGLADVTVHHRLFREPVWSEQIELEVGEERALTVDLRGILHAVDVIVVDEKGRPVENAMVSPTNPSSSLRATHTDREGRARVATRGSFEPIDLRVNAIGYKGLEFRGATDESVVVLEANLPIRVVVEGSPDLSYERYRLVLYAVSREIRSGGFCSASGECRLDGPAEVTMGFPIDGVWSLRWSLKHKTAESEWTTTVLTTAPQEIEVDDSDDEQVFRVVAPAAEIRRAVAKLERR